MPASKSQLMMRGTGDHDSHCASALCSSQYYSNRSSVCPQSSAVYIYIVHLLHASNIKVKPLSIQAQELANRGFRLWGLSWFRNSQINIFPLAPAQTPPVLLGSLYILFTGYLSPFEGPGNESGRLGVQDSNFCDRFVILDKAQKICRF